MHRTYLKLPERKTIQKEEEGNPSRNEAIEAVVLDDIFLEIYEEEGEKQSSAGCEREEERDVPRGREIRFQNNREDTREKYKVVEDAQGFISHAEHGCPFALGDHIAWVVKRADERLCLVV